VKLGVLLMSFTILFQSFNFEISDAFKFSTLIDHLAIHMEEGDGIDDFLDLHYGDKVDLHKDQHKEHRELPFKQHHMDVNIHYVNTVFEEKNLSSFIEMNAVENNFTYKNPYTNSFINNFFQPPQK